MLLIIALILIVMMLMLKAGCSDSALDLLREMQEAGRRVASPGSDANEWRK